MSLQLTIAPLAADTFAPFGDVLDCAGAPDKIINQGRCGRYHDRARLDFGEDGQAAISLFQAEPRRLPLALDLLERHPLGSQAFVPMTPDPFLVIVAEDEDGTPGTPQVFETAPLQGVNLLRNVWHGVLSPLHAPGIFAVIDRVGPGDNLEEHWLEQPPQIVR